ncbi:MAG: 2Fe-2S iron-sulfur cluster binding domain-containing protein [Holosporaceae bacterium]|jgi:2Fe-2S ferredoxin|nr:2Fe-2S iron-sulfur cluster binding domain-containing protein [Holosporaceae bacterium]
MEVVFIERDGREKRVSFSEKQTVLQVAEENHLPLHGTCEGFGVCGGCHVVIENFLDKLPPISDVEEDAMDRSSGVTTKSRLACQLVLDESLNGLRIKIV